MTDEMPDGLTPDEVHDWAPGPADKHPGYMNMHRARAVLRTVATLRAEVDGLGSDIVGYEHALRRARATVKLCVDKTPDAFSPRQLELAEKWLANDAPKLLREDLAELREKAACWDAHLENWGAGGPKADLEAEDD